MTPFEYIENHRAMIERYLREGRPVSGGSGPFAKTTLGPPAPGTTDTDKGALIADVQNGVVEMVDNNGNTHGLETMLLLLQAATAVTTITTAQLLFTQVALPAGALNKTNRAVRVSGTIIFTVATGTPTCTIALKLGAVTLCTITTAALAASTNGQLTFDFTFSVATTGSSGTIESHGQVCAQLATNLATAVAQYQDQNTAVSSAVNLTAGLNLGVTIAGSGAIASAQLRQGLIEVIN